MSFEPETPAFWDKGGLRKELDRVFEVCYGCTLCHTLCPSFVSLFQMMDENFGDAASLKDEQMKSVVDQCYQCKLCDPICPYVPPHEYDIDFPRTMMRATLVEAREHGVRWADRLMGDTDRAGRLASRVAPLVNWANRTPFVRGLMEKFLGVHRDRLLPEYHRRTFAKWLRRRPAAPGGNSGEKAALFYTCTVNYNEPDIGKAAVGVLERNGVECTVPEQQCCGMPFIDVGLLDKAVDKIRANVESLSAAVRQGCKIVVPTASCSYMLKQDYPRMLPNDDTRLVAENTLDLSEYLMQLHEGGKLDVNFTGAAGKIRYHQPCHLKAQNIGFKSQELMQLIPDTKVSRMQCCSGHDGTWSVKKENFEASMKVGRPLFKFMRSDDACAVTDCPLSAVQVEQGTQDEQGTGKKPVHPIIVVARAYGIEVGS